MIMMITVILIIIMVIMMTMMRLMTMNHRLKNNSHVNYFNISITFSRCQLSPIPKNVFPLFTSIRDNCVFSSRLSLKIWKIS